MLIAILFVCLSVGVTLYTYFRRNYFTLRNDYGRVVPGVSPEFLLGNVRQSGLLSGVPLYKVWENYHKQFGDVFQYFMGSNQITVFGHPDHVEHILTHRGIYESSDLLRAQCDILFTYGLVCLRGATHRRHARVMLPMLKKSKALGFVDVIARHVNKQVEYWKLITQGNDQLVYPHVSRDISWLTLDLIGFIAFDVDFNLLQNIKDQNGTVYDVSKIAREHSKNKEMPLSIATTYLLHRFTELILAGLPLPLMKLYASHERTYQQAKNTIRGYVLKCIANQKLKDQETKPNLLNKLLSAIPSDETQIEDDVSNNLTKEEVMDELSVILSGGFETTTTTLSWLIYYVTKNPGVQEKMKQELKQHLPDSSSELTAEVLNKLEYLECVMKETLRIAPITHAGARMAMCDDVIDGVQIKKGQEVSLSYHSVHLDPRFWKIDPTKFVPERFYGPDAPDAKPHPYAFMPFGGGHHSCAGQDLARVETKAIVAAWMRLMTFHDAPGNDGKSVQRLTCTLKALPVRLSFDS